MREKKQPTSEQLRLAWQFVVDVADENIPKSPINARIYLIQYNFVAQNIVYGKIVYDKDEN